MKFKKFVRSLFRDKIHTSWLIAGGCAGFLGGAGAAILPETAIFAGWIFLILSGAVMLLVFASRLKIMMIFVVSAGILFGLWRGTAARVDLNDYKNFIGQNVVVRGKVKEDPDFGQSHDLRVRLIDIEMILVSERERLNGEVDNIREYFTPMGGEIWASVSARGTEVKRSDMIEIGGKLRTGFGTFPASMSFAKLKNVERSPDADPARDVRDAFGEKLREVIPPPAVDLGMGILAGQKTALPFDLTAAFIAASLTHIVVASGYNLTILIRFARRLFAKISRFAAFSFSALLVIAFACVTGFSPSMTRASLVAGLSLLAWYYGRKFHPVVLLTTVAAMTILINPVAIWGDAGWYMSFLSFAGVIILAPLVKDYFWGNEVEMRTKPTLMQKIRTKILPQKSDKKLEDFGEKEHNFRGIFIETLSAQIMAAPIIALFMGQFSPYGLLANILVLPIVPLAMLLTFISGVAAFILPASLAQIIAMPATWLLNYIVGVAKFVAELPGASQTLEINSWWYAGIFLLIVMAIIYMKIKTKHDFRGDNVAE
ncbi:ComEC/Rec2 family competence protein [Candidatus Saccharibacteria bacterium]|nr:ComEC/Rec2 family competence protein [Candidatus Saccharibacteria bacterium]MCL1963028.1 ComEC/Rec2 family competence protein [Candidatus Saccharibacteria bacterium]